uniref:Rho GDP-dissociation inhibitor 1 n=1 Tax=Neolamprologus brichardi TaxID=32507 RepID=A0A3Q4HYF0_NEOBR
LGVGVVQKASCEDAQTTSNGSIHALDILLNVKQSCEAAESLHLSKESLHPNVPNVQVIRMSLVCDGAPEPLVLDLCGDLEAFKKQAFVLKEGVEYRIKIMHLSLSNVSSRLLTVDKSDYMVGSYGPRGAEYDFLTTVEEAPKGLLARGNYVIKSKFTDDDKHDHLSWEWNLNIKKDWKD